jgi:hypothetical protein
MNGLPQNCLEIQEGRLMAQLGSRPNVRSSSEQRTFLKGRGFYVLPPIWTNNPFRTSCPASGDRNR